MPGSQLSRVRAAVVWTTLVVVAIVIGSGGSAMADDRYRVRPGDTLSGIADHLGVDAGRLATANGLSDPDLIVAGKLLKVPSVSVSASAFSPTTATATASAGTAAERYRVRPGDTLSQIAPRLGVSVTQLAAANSLTNPNTIIAGRSLVVPTAAAPAPSPATTSATTAAASGTSPAVAKVGPSWECPVSGAHFVDDYGYVKPSGSTHRGVDLYAPRFAPVVAPVDGVMTPFPNPMGGLAFQLSGDDGNRYYGAHLQAYGHTGQVSAGELIGWVGNSGDAVGGPTHLHFEIHPEGGSAANPYPALARNCP